MFSFVTKEDEGKKTFLEVLDNFTSLLEKVQGIKLRNNIYY